MQVALFVVATCSVVALTWGCCTPDQWEGNQFTVGGYSGYFRRGYIREYNYAAYDATNTRKALFMNYINGDVEAKLRFVTIHKDNGGVLYIDNLSKGKCWTKKLKNEFRKACIPKGAHAYPEYSLGLKDKYKVLSFRMELEKPDVTNVLTVQPISDGVCAPISEMIVGRMYHYDVLTNVGFTDITPGISNASVFDIPKDCKEDLEGFDLPIELDREMYFLAN